MPIASLKAVLLATGCVTFNTTDWIFLEMCSLEAVVFARPGELGVTKQKEMTNAEVFLRGPSVQIRSCLLAR